MTMTESSLWYLEATLVLDGRLLRAGTLVQCARRWGNLEPDEKTRAIVRLSAPLDGMTVLQAEAIASLAARPGFRFA
jgi:hypothetical protein